MIATVDGADVDGVSKKGKNYTPTEDVLICRAWINQSENAIKGMDQKGDVFWSSVHQTYMQLLKNNGLHCTRPLHDKKSVQNCWRKSINLGVQFFCGKWSMVC